MGQRDICGTGWDTWDNAGQGGTQGTMRDKVGYKGQCGAKRREKAKFSRTRQKVIRLISSLLRLFHFVSNARKGEIRRNG